MLCQRLAQRVAVFVQAVRRLVGHRTQCAYFGDEFGAKFRAPSAPKSATKSRFFTKRLASATPSDLRRRPPPYITNPHKPVKGSRK